MSDKADVKIIPEGALTRFIQLLHDEEQTMSTAGSAADMALRSELVKIRRALCLLAFATLSTTPPESARE